MLRVVVKHNVLKITPKRSCQAATETEQSNLNVNSNIALCPIYKCAAKKKNQRTFPQKEIKIICQAHRHLWLPKVNRKRTKGNNLTARRVSSDSGMV